MVREVCFRSAMLREEGERCCERSGREDVCGVWFFLVIAPRFMFLFGPRDEVTDTVPLWRADVADLDGW